MPSDPKNLILDFEILQLRKRYLHAYERLVSFMDHPEVAELVCRMLTSRVLGDACGYGMKYGYSGSLGSEDGLIDRMEFITFFVGHEILDDGEPALCWCRYNAESGGWDECAETDKRATPASMPRDYGS